MAIEGLNLATRPGEGFAGVNNWSQFYGTIDKIYDQDMRDQKAAADAAAKLQVKLNDEAGKIRVADQPEFHNNFNQFRDLKMKATQTRNLKDKALLNAQADDFYQKNIILASQSEDAKKFPLDLSKGYLAKGGNGFIDGDQFHSMLSEYDKTPTSQLATKGLNDVTKYTVKPDQIKFEQIDKSNRGAPVKIDALEEVRNDAGDVISYNKVQRSAYQNHEDPSLIASNVVHNIKGNRDYKSQVHENYWNDNQNSPQNVTSTIEKANDIINQHNQKTGVQTAKLDNNEYDYEVAKNIVTSQPGEGRTIGTAPSREYDRKVTEAFRLKMTKDAQAFQKSQQQRGFAHAEYMKSLEKPTVPTLGYSQEYYQAANNSKPVFDLGGGVTISGYDYTKKVAKAVATQNAKTSRAAVIGEPTFQNRAELMDAYVNIYPTGYDPKESGSKNGLTLTQRIDKLYAPGTQTSEQQQLKQSILNDFGRSVGANLKIADLKKNITIFTKLSPDGEGGVKTTWNTFDPNKMMPDTYEQAMSTEIGYQKQVKPSRNIVTAIQLQANRKK